MEQIAPLKEGRIDVGFGRILLDDPALDRLLLRNETLVVHSRRTTAVGAGADMRLADPPGGDADHLSEGAAAELRRPECSASSGARHEARPAQRGPRTADARSVWSPPEVGLCIVPAGVQRFRRDNVFYRRIDDPTAVSPIILSTRKGDRSGEIALLLKLIRQLYAKDGIIFGK